MTRTQIWNHFSRNMDKARLQHSLRLLIERGLVRGTQAKDTGGAPKTTFFAVHDDS